MPILRRASRADRKQNARPDKAFQVHLSGAGFPGFVSRSGWVGSNRNSSGAALVTGFRALRATILRWTSSSAEGFWAESMMPAAIEVGAVFIASVAIRLVDFPFTRDRVRRKSCMPLVVT